MRSITLSACAWVMTLWSTSAARRGFALEMSFVSNCSLVMPLSFARSETFWPFRRSARSVLGVMPSTSASDSNTARAIARRSVRWSVAGALVLADGVGVGVGLAAWTTPRPKIAAAAAALTALTATAANGVIVNTSLRYSIRGSGITMRWPCQRLIAPESVFCNRTPCRHRVLRLVDSQRPTARKLEVSEAAPAELVDRPLENDSFALELRHRGLQVFAHQVEPVSYTHLTL